MASIGTLVAGVSHSVNNPLAYVVGNMGFAIEVETLAKQGTEKSHESKRDDEAAAPS
jgi:hypothetical protein